MALTLQQLVWLRNYALSDLEARKQAYPKLVRLGKITEHESKAGLIYAAQIVVLINELIDKKTDAAIEARAAYDYET